MACYHCAADLLLFVTASGRQKIKSSHQGHHGSVEIAGKNKNNLLLKTKIKKLFTALSACPAIALKKADVL